MKKYNVAIIVGSLNGGGAERVAGYLSKRLEDKYNVFVFLRSTSPIVYEYGGKIIDIGYAWPFCDDAIREQKKICKIDVAISFLEEENAANIRTKGNEKVIVSTRCAYTNINPPMYSDDFLKKEFYEYADEIVACSKGIEEELKDSYKISNSITTIYNFVHKSTINSMSNEPLDKEIDAFLGGEKYFINVGRLHKQKNQLGLIREFAYYRKISGDGKLLILGDGEESGALNSEIEELNMRSYIKIVRFEKNPFKYIKSAFALISTSQYEGLPNTLLEAMVLGVPIISTDCLSGPRELLDDKCDYNEKLTDARIAKRGILMPLVFDDEHHHLANAMQILNGDILLQRDISRHQREYIHKYSNEKLLEQWETLIEKKNEKDRKMPPNKNDILQSSKKILIFGAGHVGGLVFDRYSRLCRIDSFLVSRDEDAGEAINNIPVICIENIKEPEECCVIIGVGNALWCEVVGLLQSHGFNRIIFP